MSCQRCGLRQAVATVSSISAAITLHVCADCSPVPIGPKRPIAVSDEPPAVPGMEPDEDAAQAPRRTKGDDAAAAQHEPDPGKGLLYLKCALDVANLLVAECVQSGGNVTSDNAMRLRAMRRAYGDFVKSAFYELEAPVVFTRKRVHHIAHGLDGDGWASYLHEPRDFRLRKARASAAAAAASSEGSPADQAEAIQREGLFRGDPACVQLELYGKLLTPSVDFEHAAVWHQRSPLSSDFHPNTLLTTVRYVKHGNEPLGIGKYGSVWAASRAPLIDEPVYVLKEIVFNPVKNKKLDMVANHELAAHELVERIRLLSPRLAQHFIRMHDYGLEKREGRKQAINIVLERLGNALQDEVIEKDLRALPQFEQNRYFVSIMLQYMSAVWTLRAADVYFEHNDLHSGNAYMTSTDEAVLTCYFPERRQGRLIVGRRVDIPAAWTDSKLLKIADFGVTAMAYSRPDGSQAVSSNSFEGWTIDTSTRGGRGVASTLSTLLFYIGALELSAEMGTYTRKSDKSILDFVLRIASRTLSADNVKLNLAPFDTSVIGMPPPLAMPYEASESVRKPLHLAPINSSLRYNAEQPGGLELSRAYDIARAIGADMRRRGLNRSGLMEPHSATTHALLFAYWQLVGAGLAASHAPTLSMPKSVYDKVTSDLFARASSDWLTVLGEVSGPEKLLIYAIDDNTQDYDDDWLSGAGAVRLGILRGDPFCVLLALRAEHADIMSSATLDDFTFATFWHNMDPRSTGDAPHQVYDLLNESRHNSGQRCLLVRTASRNVILAHLCIEHIRRLQPGSMRHIVPLRDFGIVFSGFSLVLDSEPVIRQLGTGIGELVSQEQGASDDVLLRYIASACVQLASALYELSVGAGIDISDAISHDGYGVGVRMQSACLLEATTQQVIGCFYADYAHANVAFGRKVSVPASWTQGQLVKLYDLTPFAALNFALPSVAAFNNTLKASALVFKCVKNTAITLALQCDNDMVSSAVRTAFADVSTRSTRYNDWLSRLLAALSQLCGEQLESYAELVATSWAPRVTDGPSEGAYTGMTTARQT